jgi:hypothetical protein
MRIRLRRPSRLALGARHLAVLAALGCSGQRRDAAGLPSLHATAAQLVMFAPRACPLDLRAAAQHAASLAALATAHWDRVAFEPREAGVSIELSRQAIHCLGSTDTMAQRDAEMAVLASREALLWRMVQDARRRFLRAHEEDRVADTVADGQRLLDFLEPQNPHVAELRRSAAAWLRAAQGRINAGKDDK